MNDEEYIAQKLQEGIHHFICEKCEEIKKAWALNSEWKPENKGLCKECFQKKMLQKYERYEGKEGWNLIME